MDDYNKYVTDINKIFDYIEKMKAGWNNTDNKNYIETIEDFKGVVTSKAELIKQPPKVKEDVPSTENQPQASTQIAVKPTTIQQTQQQPNIQTKQELTEAIQSLSQQQPQVPVQTNNNPQIGEVSVQ